MHCAYTLGYLGRLRSTVRIYWMCYVPNPTYGVSYGVKIKCHNIPNSNRVTGNTPPPTPRNILWRMLLIVIKAKIMRQRCDACTSLGRKQYFSKRPHWCFLLESERWSLYDQNGLQQSMDCRSSSWISACKLKSGPESYPGACVARDRTEEEMKQHRVIVSLRSRIKDQPTIRG